MNTEEPDLVAYRLGEHSDEEARRMREHLAAAPDLAKEEEAVAEFLDQARAALRPVAAPDRLAFNIMRRIRENGTTPVTEPGAASRRLEALRNRAAPVSGHRWRSLALSLALHAAVLCLLMGTAVWIGHHEFGGGITVDTTLQQRRHAPRTTVAMTQGAISIASIRSAEAMYLTDDKDGCIWAFPVGGPGNPSEAAFLANINPAEQSRLHRVATDDGVLRIPDALRVSLLGDTETVLVLAMGNHLEIWAPDRLERYEDGLAARSPDPGSAVLLAIFIR